MTPPASSSTTDAKTLALVVSIRRASDVVFLQRRVRVLSLGAGFDPAAAWSVATAASEMATNILKYVGTGQVELHVARQGAEVEVVARDRGPGIPDVQLALRDWVSQGRDLTRPENLDRPHSLGCGLPAISRLMDSLEIDSTADGGTTVRARKLRAPTERPGQPPRD